MGRVSFIFALHDHQPVGNFEHVLEDAYVRAYAPMLEVLFRHPQVRFCLHKSGVLWEWIEARHPEYLERVRVMLQRGQVELLSGGFYEPILPAIPEVDRQGQLMRQTEWLQSRFGVAARGAWLAERVWEPQLAQSLVRAGLAYTVLDDTHFQSAGWPAESLVGSFVTEDNGYLLRVFPIAKALRYLLPFEEPEATLEFLRRQADTAPQVLLVHADDGEKFGVWPGTHARCYEQGWLERFCTALETEADWLHPTTFADSLASHPPRGRIYLPTASYSEMMEWALPAAAQPKLHAARAMVAALADGGELQQFIHGGFWRNFLARYPEGNWMHKKMLHVSRRLEQSREPDQAQDAATTHLWRGQCNCAYWHGLFGGLYLPHLRSAIYHELIRADTLAAQGMQEREVLDYDVDGRPEILLSSARALAVLKPDSGGAVYELDDRQRGFNVLDVLTRRPEAYHDKLRHLDTAGSDDAEKAVSIHDLVRVKAPDLVRSLVYDAYRKGSFIDHLFPAKATWEDFAAAALPDLVPLATLAYDWRLEPDGVRLECNASFATPAGLGQILVVRRMRLTDRDLEADYEVWLEGESVDTSRFGIELAANLLAGNAPDRWLEVNGSRLADGHLASRGSSGGVRRLDVVDAWSGVRVVMRCSEPMDVWRAPIETVSTSESGFERVYQGSCFLFVASRPLQRGERWSATVVQSLGDA